MRRLTLCAILSWMVFAGVRLAWTQTEPPVRIVASPNDAPSMLSNSPETFFSSRPQTEDSSIYAGYTFLFSKLAYKESFETTVSNFGNGTMQLLPIANEFELTPRVWIGLRGLGGTGFRASYWNYDHRSTGSNLVSDGIAVPSATSTSVIFPALIVAPFPGDQLTAVTSQLATNVDLEGTLDVQLQRLELSFGGGIRYAHSDQRFDAIVIPGPVPGATGAALNWLREFEGFGPLFTARGKLPLGCRGLYGVGGVNVSFLFGEKTLRRLVINDATPLPNRGLPNLVFDSEEITGVYGSNLGLGWECDTRLGRMAVEGTYEGQLWTEGGAPTITFAGFNGLGLTLRLAY